MKNNSGLVIPFRVSEIMYLIMAAIAAFEAVVRFNTSLLESGIMALFTVIGIFMYFFRRNRRLRMEANRKNK